MNIVVGEYRKALEERHRAAVSGPLPGEEPGATALAVEQARWRQFALGMHAVLGRTA